MGDVRKEEIVILLKRGFCSHFFFFRGVDGNFVGRYGRYCRRLLLAIIFCTVRLENGRALAGFAQILGLFVFVHGIGILKENFSFAERRFDPSRSNYKSGNSLLYSGSLCNLRLYGVP